jgi:hypothetical protein
MQQILLFRGMKHLIEMFFHRSALKQAAPGKTVPWYPRRSIADVTETGTETALSGFNAPE